MTDYRNSVPWGRFGDLQIFFIHLSPERDTAFSTYYKTRLGFALSSKFSSV